MFSKYHRMMEENAEKIDALNIILNGQSIIEMVVRRVLQNVLFYILVSNIFTHLIVK